MSNGDIHGNGSRQVPNHGRTLAILAVFSTCLYGIIALLSWRFEFDRPVEQRPIVPVLILFGAAFASYLFAIRLAARTTQDRKLLALIVWPAIMFRVVLLFSVPIQEIDIYRYLWDGSVSTTGISPFRYSPEQVRVAATSSTTDENLRPLVKLLDRQPALVEILHRVHFGELPTIYPPVSQVVFATAALTTPSNSSLASHVFIMKTWLVGFDLATLAVVVGLLKLCRKPIGLCLIYAWCPLLLKEVANSGHLDAIAVFLTTLAIYLASRLLLKLDNMPTASLLVIKDVSAAVVVLALAIGAKLYPVVLAPLVFAVFAKRIGLLRCLIPAAVFVAVTIIAVWPLLPHDLDVLSASSKTATDDGPPDPRKSPKADSFPPNVDPSLGVMTFMRHWEMNDFVFLLLVENLKPDLRQTPDRTAWFSVVPHSVRQRLVAAVAAWIGIPDVEVPFFVARLITATIFISIACWLAFRTVRTSDVSAFCEATFLTLAWFWLLCPTQNPWYWTWVLPLLPFASNRAWLTMSGLVLLYYLRFWFSYHFPESPILGTPYSGPTFFDFVMTWIEYAPWFVWLTYESLMSNQRQPVDELSPTTCLAKNDAAA